MITIESGIPIPPQGRRDVYRFGELKVGQSVSIPLTGDFLPNGKRPEYNRIRTAATRYGHNHDKTFEVRIMRDEGVVRCWRVA